MGRKPGIMGLDWSELSLAFLEKTRNLSDEVLLIRTKEYIWESLGKRNKTKRVAKTIRLFLAKLTERSKGIDYNWPVWNGLLEIEDDETLIKFTWSLLGEMWV